jgi:hypothetical protein
VNLRCSGLLTESTLVNTGRTRLHSMLMLTNGMTDLTVIVYDNTVASGTIVVKYKLVGTLYFATINFYEYPLWLYNGLYASLSGFGGEVIVYYTKEYDF